MLNRLLALFCFMGIALTSFAQKDPVLFTVEGTPVNVSEFKYIYEKTNGEKADFSKKSLEEYLDLYLKFKLKVQRAKDMQLDTIPSLKKELAGYRKQLANSYLVDKEMMNRLVKEAYDRSKKEIKISHILVKVLPNADPVDTLFAYNQALTVKKALDKGLSFADAAKKYSQDDYTKDQGGQLGYFAAMFNAGFYNLENVAYKLKKGQYSNPVRTPIGYHIVLVEDIRPAKGEIEAAHILIRKNKENKKTVKAKTTIDSIYNELQKGANFEAMAKAVSQHKKTASKGGYLGFIKTNSSIEPGFKEAILGLAKDNDISQPFESSVGWHIAKRISKKEAEAEDIAMRRLQTKIQNNAKGATGKSSRLELAKDSFIKSVQNEANFTENQAGIKQLFAETDSTYTTHLWKADIENPTVLFTFGNETKYTIGNFNKYSRRSSLRFRKKDKKDYKSAIQMVYDDFVKTSTLEYEESQLENKYPEFKALMREYSEGILLFEATKLQVWDKASIDTVGLEKFYDSNKAKYQWKKRAVVDEYTITRGNDKQIAAIREAVKAGKSTDAILKQFNINKKKVVSVQERTIETGRNKALDAITWSKGAITKATKDNKSKKSTFVVIKEVKQPGQKSLEEGRGYVIADYQEFLEKTWIEELKNLYKVDINQKVLNSITK